MLNKRQFRLLPQLATLAALALSASLAIFPQSVLAANTNIAVAANFTDAAKEIGALFEKVTGHKAIFSFGSTGQLFTQIAKDAPFEVFLSADQATARKAVDDGFAVPGSRFVYATGKLVLFSREKTIVTGEQTLKDGKFLKIAIANPATAPYGAAAVEVMKALGVLDSLKGKFVQGNNIAQTYQFVSTGNAEVGFVALSQLVLHNNGSRWMVPEKLHTTIAQDAVLLKKGAGSDAAKAFIAFLKGPEARAVKEKFGYGAGD